MAGEAPIEHDPRWPVVSLAEIATKIGSGATPKGGADAYLPTRERYALVRSQNVFDRRFDHAGIAFITDEQADGLRGVVLQRADILLNITGDGITFGRACMVPADVLPACVNQHVSIIRVDARRADPGYVLGFLTYPHVKSYIESFNAGGSRRAITKGHIESFRLPLPPLAEQRAIAHILGTLDDKIELNRRMNETLEAMARALFKSWFVDFDPVRAKAEGRQPWGMDAATAALFPSDFEDSELGEIPKGWDVGALADIAEFSRWTVNPRGSPDEVFDHYSLPAFDEGKSPRAERGDTIKSNKFVVGPQAVLVSKLNPQIPRVWLPDVARTRRSVCSTEFMVLEARAPASRSYVYSMCSGAEITQALGSMVTGTTGSHQRVPASSFAALSCVLPAPSTMRAFSRFAESILARVLACRAESRALAELRDTLLPKLLSGEVRVREAECAVEAAL